MAWSEAARIAAAEARRRNKSKQYISASSVRGVLQANSAENRKFHKYKQNKTRKLSGLHAVVSNSSSRVAQAYPSRITSIFGFKKP